MFVFFLGVIIIVLLWECEEGANGGGYFLAFVSRLFTHLSTRDKNVKACVFSGPMATKMISDKLMELNNPVL